MRVFVVAALLLMGGASAGLAHIGAWSLPQMPQLTGQAQMGTPAAPPKKARPGVKTPPSDGVASAVKPGEKSTGQDEVVTETLASCLAMWERATHMSKQEWARACRRV